MTEYISPSPNPAERRDILGLVFYAITPGAGESLNCLTVYKEGGAPAVFRSPKCPRWTLSSFVSPSELPSVTCQTAMLQGRRKSQEDRALCAFDLRIPFLGPKGVKEIKVGIMAIFDGHNGSEASEMASATLFQYFVLHTYFLLDTTYSILFKKLIRRLPNKGEDAPDFLKMDWGEDLDRQFLNHGRFKVALSSIIDGSFPFELLREALLRAIHDIDAAFTEDASRYNLNSGTTAVVVLLADTQILVANVGDSKAFLCTEVYQSPSEAKATVSRLVRQQRSSGVSSSLMEFRQLKSMASDGWKILVAKELTNDHRPDRDDEKSRVESTGGHISNWAGVARVNGQLAVSRAIGDVQFKSFGVIPVPEVTDWQPLTANDSFVIAASDGVFEKLSPQDICDVLWEPLSNFTRRPKHKSSCLFSSVDCIVNTAFDEGSMDNLAVTMVPIRSRGSFVGDRGYTYLAAEINSRSVNCSADGKTSVLPLLQTHPGVSNLDRLLVEGKYSNFGCFYLSENLDVNDGYTFWVHKDDQESVSDLSPALSGADHFSWSGPLDVYNDQQACLHFRLYINEGEDRCIYSDGFARFLGLLESIPFHNTGQNERETLGTRYILKKKFDRGAFGEVWLAFNWNCTQVAKDLKRRNVGNDYLHQNEDMKADGGDAGTKIHAEDCNASYSDGNMFILKRIMVERGIAAYLSGLREKYFGELFLNASNSLKVSSFSGDLDSFCQMPGCSAHCFTNTSESVGYVIEDPFIAEDMTLRESGRHEDASHEEGLSHIARYIESFESQSNEIWLVFHHEGVSLSKLLYTAEEVVTVTDEQSEHVNRMKILRPSSWWHWLKTTEAGQEEFRNIIWQLLMGLKACHDRGVTHRDIKPENMLICFQDQDSRSCLRGIPDSNKNYSITIRIIDFGSAVNDFTVKHLYGSAGPSSAEQTSDYAPPEALLNASWYQGPASVSTKYDMWSTGVVILELILGSPHVFQISSKTQALLEHHLHGWTESLKELAYKLRALMEMCILVSGTSSEIHKNGQGSSPPVPWKCSEEHFSHLIKSRDPLKLGFPNKWALRLVRDLLEWDPGKRFSVDDALKHPYFSRAS